jgi:hypothetical protein
LNPLVIAPLCIVLVLAQDAFPESPWFHHGSYAALLLALVGLQWWALRRRPAELLAVCGATVIAVAGLASSLFAPDLQTIVAGPGQTVNLNEPASALQFPVSQPPSSPVLHRPGKGDLTIDIGGRHIFLANYILWTQPRTAAYIEAFDGRGAHLTVTQPQATSVPFLSPVLLFIETKEFNDPKSSLPATLPVDSFSLPAVHRSVNAVLFSKDVVAKMQRLAGDARPGILFAVADDRGKQLQGALGLARSGDTIALGGVRLHPIIEEFPTVVIASGPYLPVVLLGVLIFVAGILKNRFRWRSGSLRS